ncbi:hypothetical protein AVEN_155133-1 [Araneus ventricosus]|uniref:Uncharacterized protein n=1 Tax=Araneus ventricosus TaxID=182803 RepID=A0A4Y2MJW4_ARAVE|nr:hypothetical protein AVEN_155133-1 [Araneus ventricosus]
MSDSGLSRRVAGSKPESIKTPSRMWAWRTLNLMSRVKCPPIGVVWKFGEEALTQVSSSPSGHGSELRDASKNSPRGA